jgi:recombinational DNA repair ATPase RecF
VALASVGSLDNMKDYDANEHVKAVYAHFGLAVYSAQVLEHGLANALVCAELLPRRAGKPTVRKQWEAEFDTFINQQFEQTLGRLIRSLKAAAPVPDDLETLLAAALGRRNFLAHHYFRERAEEFITRDGRERMITELREAQKLFESADDRLGQVAIPLREKYGLTDEKLQPFMDQYMARLQKDP